MPKILSRNPLFFKPIRWQLFSSIALLIYPLSRAISCHVLSNPDTMAPGMGPQTLTSLFINVVSEFGALVVLFGLCVFTLFIGLRMLLLPAAGWKEE